MPLTMIVSKTCEKCPYLLYIGVACLQQAFIFLIDFFYNDFIQHLAVMEHSPSKFEIVNNLHKWTPKITFDITNHMCLSHINPTQEGRKEVQEMNWYRGTILT
jgi:hypothetical protein